MKVIGQGTFFIDQKKPITLSTVRLPVSTVFPKIDLTKVQHMKSTNYVFNLDQRKKESRQILSKYPDRVPVVVQKAPNSNLTDLDKHKFLVPYEVTVAQFMWILRQRLTLSPAKAIYVFINRTLPQSRYLQQLSNY